MFLLKAGVNIHNRNFCTLIRPISCLFAAVLLPVWKKIVNRRGNETSIGFGAKVSSPEEKSIGEVLKDVQPEDLLKFGLIPEFIGRLPIIATLDDLKEDALVCVLTEPKNALVKQYEALFEMEGVKLTITEEALKAIAKKLLNARPALVVCGRLWKKICCRLCMIFRIRKTLAKLL